MSYIWEDKNRGKSLLEMALDTKTAIMESMSVAVPLNAPQNGGNFDELNKAIADTYGVKVGQDYVIQANGNRPVLQCTPEVAKQIKNDPNLKQYVSGEDDPAKERETTRTSIGDIIKSLDIDDARKRELAIGLHCIAAGKWFDGGDCTNPEQEKVVKSVMTALRSGDPSKAKETLLKVNAFTERAGIHPDKKNDQLFKKDHDGKMVTGSVQMPAMFDTEPDDSMWDDMIVTDFGMALVNLGHPAVSKIIKSDNPEEDCPADLKAFKKAVYGDKRLTAVFGEGGLARMLGKMANLCTLGIAGATVDAGKRADRIIKELHEKGGRIVHRNLLLVKAGDIMDADPDNEELTIPCTAYCRSKQKFVGTSFDVPAAALKQFYSAVDPIKSAKIYVEMYSNFPEAESALTESANFDGNVLVEGPFSAIAGGLRKATDKLHITDKADDPSKKKDGGKISELKEKFIAYINKNGHPPYYVLKPKSDNKEVDVVSTSKTGQAGTSGKAVHMVTMKIDDHKAAAFMTPDEIKNYFSV